MSARLISVYLVAIGCAVCTHGAALADAPTPSSAVSDALENLSSPEYNEREKAVRTIDHQLAIIPQSLLHTDDEEALAKVGETFQFNQRLSQWLFAVSKMPHDQREKQIALLDRPEMASLLPKLFSAEAPIRREGIRQFGSSEGDSANALLIYLLNDESAPVAAASLEVMWDRPASPEIIDELWRRGVKLPLDLSFEQPTAVPAENLAFKGQSFAVDVPTYSSFPQLYGADEAKSRIARIVLGHLKGPELAKDVCAELKSVITRLNEGADFPQISVRRLRRPLIALAGVAADADVKAAIPSLIELMNVALGKMKSQVITDPAHATMSFYSVRTEALAALARLTGQAPEEYGLHSGPDSYGWLAETGGSEQVAVTKMNAWWKEHSSQFALIDNTHPKTSRN